MSAKLALALIFLLYRADCFVSPPPIVVRPPNRISPLTDRVNPYEGEEEQGYIKFLRSKAEAEKEEAFGGDGDVGKKNASDDSSGSESVGQKNEEESRGPVRKKRKPLLILEKVASFLARTTLSYEGAYSKKKESTEGYVSHDNIILRENTSLGGIPRMERYTASDWLHNIRTVPFSSILRQIAGPVIWCSIMGVVVSLIHRLGSIAGVVVNSHIAITKTPHTLLGSALGLLLVFRTNTAYSRFWEGRTIWERVLCTSRDLSRMVKLYEGEIGKEKRLRCMCLLAAFPYLLRQRVQPNWLLKKMERDERKARGEVSKEIVEAEDRKELLDINKIDKLMKNISKKQIPWTLLPEETIRRCSSAQNRPLWVCDRLAQEFKRVRDSDSFSSRERLVLIGLCDRLSKSIGECERIVQTPVPLNYARHTIRFLTLWCLTLPFAVCGELGLATGPVIGVLTWALFGIYEIGVQIEDPFQRTLKLSVICEQIKNEIVDEDWRDRRSAFNFDEAKLDQTHHLPQKIEKTSEETNEYEEEILKKERAIRLADEWGAYGPYGGSPSSSSSSSSFPRLTAR